MRTGSALSVLLALIEVWGGIAASYYVNWPASSFIASLSFGFYAVSWLSRRALIASVIGRLRDPGSRGAAAPG